MFLACWVGIPVYLIFIIIVSDNYDRLKFQSRELLSSLLAGLEIPGYLVFLIIVS